MGTQEKDEVKGSRNYGKIESSYSFTLGTDIFYFKPGNQEGS